MKNRMSHLIFLTIMSFPLIACDKSSDTSVPQQIILTDNWMIQQSDKVGVDGKDISSANVVLENWYPAEVPSTVMGVLTENGLYKDLFIGTNYKSADRTPFDSPWWYRTTFKLPDLTGKHVALQFDGLSYRANIWFNGQLVAPKEEVYGPFCRFSFDITDMAKEDNVLAVEIFRAHEGEPNIGFVDWNPRPLDENMGLFREVKLNITGAVEMKNTWVKSVVNTETLKQASLNIETELKNLSESPIEGQLMGEIESIKFNIPVKLAGKETKAIQITPEQVKELSIQNPRLWWSCDLGNPELYELKLKFITSGRTSSEENITFGIRQIDTYFTDEGHKGFILNGKKVLIKGAGWTDDIFLRDTPESNERQVKYVKDMNLNTIRFENIWGTSRNIYELCDKYGIMALIGWSCQWEWENYFGKPDDDFGCIRTEHDMNLLTRFLHDQVLWLRNQPSIIAFYGGSDKLLHPELEKKYMELLPKIYDRPYIGSAKTMTSTVTGPTGMKMYGPYEYVGPNYWFIDTQYGGAYGFNTETGPGAQLPVYESIIKMVPKDQLWPISEAWNYHCTTSTTAMNNLDVLTKTMNAKYGKADNIEDYLRKADLISYESTKSMFEAFRVNKPQATGLIQWMLNSAWPSMYWQLYDYYGIPNSAYYGVKTANNLCQLIYNYKDNGIYAVNETLSDAQNLKAVIRTYSIHSKLLVEKELEISIASNSSKKIFDIDNSQKNTFVSLRLFKGNEQVADNFYVLSSKKDTYDWDKTDWVNTPMTGYADFKELATVSEADVKLNTTTGTKNGYPTVKVELKNNSNVIAFFVNLKLKSAEGEILFPVYWSDNYVSILPGETKILECRIEDKNSDISTSQISIEGWNVKRTKEEMK